MIHIDNSAKKRFFFGLDIDSDKNKNIKNYINEIEDYIDKLEKNKKLKISNYLEIKDELYYGTKLNEKDREQVSFLYFDKKIRFELDKLIKEKIFEDELNFLRKYLKPILVGNFKTLKKFIKMLKSTSYGDFLIQNEVFEKRIKEIEGNLKDKITKELAKKYKTQKNKKELNKAIKNELSRRLKIELFKNKDLYKYYTCFPKYKETFGRLYKTHLSTDTDPSNNGEFGLKKGFFKLFKDVNVCPYCNRNFINPIYKEKTEDTKREDDNYVQSPDIEHFFPKSIYPFLSLSISNLIPSCSFCNKIKSNYDTFKEGFLSPYEIKENDKNFKFNFEFEKVNRIKMNLETTREAKLNKKVLHLENLYNEVHENYVNDIFGKLLKSNSLHEEYIKSFNVFKDETDENYKTMFNNYYKESEFNKHPLSKMTKDLFIDIRDKIIE